MILDLMPQYKIYLPNGEAPQFQKLDDKLLNAIVGEIRAPIQLLGEYSQDGLPSFVSIFGQPQDSESVQEYLVKNCIMGLVSGLPANMFAVETFRKVENIVRLYKVGFHEFWAGNVNLYGVLFQE